MPSSVSCINGCLAIIDSDGNMLVTTRGSICAVLAAWLNSSQRSQVDVGMNSTPREREGVSKVC